MAGFISKRTIGKMLIANRGEIAMRVMRTCKRLGINTAIVYTTADAGTPAVNMADESVWIGDAREYLDMEKVIQAAKRVKADAVHPGFGFLSENADFARRVEEEGFIFVGPSSHSISAMGSKSEAKKLLTRGHYTGMIPVIPGYHGDNQDVGLFMSEARKIGFPVLLKASAGGGGKGMRIVYEEKDLPSAIESAKREALESFGSDKLLIEKYFASVRHVEIQIFGDASAHVIHLGERDCSVQRRHQKVIEESPSPQFLSLGVEGDAIREKMGRVAVTIGEAIQYKNAGTVEFILDDQNNFYFLEVNTRLQVEHPVTEMITNLDLVELQIRVAEGYTFQELGISQQSITRKGHAIQCRLYAEDPLNEFLPAPGRLTKWIPADVENVRFDSGIQSGSEISMYYDPMVAKIIAWGPNRLAALQRMRRALRETVIVGLVTNAQFLLQVLDHPEFIAGRYNTHFIQNHLPAPVRQQVLTAPLPEDLLEEVALAGTCFLFEVNQQSRTYWRHVTPNFRNAWSKPEWKTFLIGDKEVKVEYTVEPRPHKDTLQDASVLFSCTVLDKKRRVLFERPFTGVEIINNPRHGTVQGRIFITIDGRKAAFFALYTNQTGELALHTLNLGRTIRLKVLQRLVLPQPDASSSANIVTAPMTGKIVTINVESGQPVKKGELLYVMESMKMETKILSLRDGIVDEILTKPGIVVDEGKAILTYKQQLPAGPPAKK